jgi:hypothetical protein
MGTKAERKEMLTEPKDKKSLASKMQKLRSWIGKKLLRRILFYLLEHWDEIEPIIEAIEAFVF